MFVAKKVIAAFVLPPGIFVAVLLLIGMVMVFTRRYKLFAVNILLALSLWGLSISPVSHTLIRGLETGLSVPKDAKGDVIILLGGGNMEFARDLTGSGFPTGNTLARVVTAVRLYRRLQAPVLVACGSVFPEQVPGAHTIARLLIDMGVPEHDVILETKSRDTYENARFAKDICRKKGFKRPLLLTSPTHMKRARMMFAHWGLGVVPVPAFLHAVDFSAMYWYDYLPRYEVFCQSAAALHECTGLAYYWLVL